ncbi:MAG: hypothetical protein ACRELB_17575, partial [Polyangiaceae bacterium]
PREALMKRILFSALALVLAFLAGTLRAGDAQRSTYTDATYGFSIDPPAFAHATRTAIVLTTYGPAVGGFPPNMNVMVQKSLLPRQAEIDVLKTQLATTGNKIVAEKQMTVAGHDAFGIEYEGAVNGRRLHFLLLKVIDGEQEFSIRYTATADEYPKVEKLFHDSFDSFQLAK